MPLTLSCKIHQRFLEIFVEGDRYAYQAPVTRNNGISESAQLALISTLHH